MTIARPAALVGHVVEFEVSGHGPALGIVANIPPRTVLARVDHIGLPGGSAAGMLVCYTPDGARVIVPTDRALTDWGPAEAGWGRLR